MGARELRRCNNVGRRCMDVKPGPEGGAAAPTGTAAPLEVLEARIVYDALLDRFAPIRLAAESRNRSALEVRG